MALCPEKLVILWNKNDGNCHTKPVPWQPGSNNPFCGIHVWPEPDPVTFKTTLRKNPEREGTYVDCPWEIIIKNETKKGQRKVIARGSFDLDDYISEEQKDSELTVTLNSTNKDIIETGSIEFQLTTVMLEGGVPYCNKEEELKEYLADAIKSTSALKKAKKGNKNGCGSGSSGSSMTGSNHEQSKPQENSLHTMAPSKPASASHIGVSTNDGGLNKTLGKKANDADAGDSIAWGKTGFSETQSYAKEHSVQTFATIKPASSPRNNGGPRKPWRKPPPIPPRPSRLPQVLRRNPAPVPHAEEGKSNSIQAKTEAVQRSKEQQPPNSGNTSKSLNRKQKKKHKTKDLKELNSNEEGKTSFEGLSHCEETPVTSATGTEGKETPSPLNRFGWRGRRKKKNPKELNSFSGSSKEECGKKFMKDAMGTAGKGKTTSGKVKQRIEYPKKLNPFCCSSDSSQRGKVSTPMKTSPENATSAIKREDKKGGAYCSSAPSPAPQHTCRRIGRKSSEQEPETMPLQKPEKEENFTLGHPENWDSTQTSMYKDNILNDTAELKKANSSDVEQTDNKAMAAKISQTKPEEAAQVVVVGAIDVTGQDPSEVLTEQEEQALRDECCDVVESVATAGEGPLLSDVSCAEFQHTGEQSCEITDGEAVQCDAVETVTHVSNSFSRGDKLPLTSEATPTAYKDNVPESEVDNGSQESEDAATVHADVSVDEDKRSYSKVMQSRLELSAYIAEEMYFLDQEIHSLCNVIFNLEKELKDAMTFEERQEEFNGLKQDWLSLIDYQAQLNTRKQNLENLQLSENLEQCVDILRTELKLLFDMEDWRKSDRQRTQEASLVGLVLFFETKRRENC